MDSWASTSNLSGFVDGMPGCQVLALLEVTTGILLAASDEARLPGRLFNLAAQASSAFFPKAGPTEGEAGTGREMVLPGPDALYVLAKLPSVYGLVLVASFRPGTNSLDAVASVRRVVATLESEFDLGRWSEPPAASGRPVSGFRLAGTAQEAALRAGRRS